ncbi:MAG: hypothetical protein XD93_0797 [candidate division WS6 bacterium 34_10]|uniref:Uncharacterized protein n=1 Tax=candidate division WS6 bacterium 34_10 TaxID=1641389 RepID=A0A117LZY2_9BACT|nr:MAG: hypothetical protein XD93_0797 [candidate division WS6 bacterium 34_10]
MDIHRVEVGKFDQDNLPPIEEKDRFLPFGDDFDEIAGFDEDDWEDEFKRIRKREDEWEDMNDDEIDDEL